MGACGFVYRHLNGMHSLVVHHVISDLGPDRFDQLPRGPATISAAREASRT